MGGLIRRVVRWVTTTFAVLIERLITVGLIQSGVVLAAQTFLALLPLLIVAIALFPAPVADAITETLRNRLGLSGESTELVGTIVKNRDSLRGGISVFGAVVALASATSFTRALQRIYELAWNLPRLGLRGSLRGLVWLTGIIIYLTVISFAVKLAGSGGVGPILRPTLLCIGAILLWWWTPYVLLLGRVRLRALAPSGVLTGVVMAILGWTSTVVLPRTVRNNERQFGTIGAIFAIESWLVIVSVCIVAAAVVGAVAAQLDGPIGRLARGRDDLEGWRRVRPTGSDAAGPARR
jgi:membrane protein